MVTVLMGSSQAFLVQFPPVVVITQQQQQQLTKGKNAAPHLPIRPPSTKRPLSLLFAVIDPISEPETTQPPSVDTASSSSSSSIYSLPALYDLAFGYRDYEEEVEFLFSKHMEIVGSDVVPTRILEIAAGPARHGITALLHPLLWNDNDDDGDDNTMKDEVPTVYCIDTSTEMAEYAQQVLVDEMDQHESSSMICDKEMIQSKFHYQIADMRNFTLSSQPAALSPRNDVIVVVDTVWILLGSLQHMLTNQDVLDCFQCIHRVLSDDNGTVFIELPHPRESTFNIMECTRNGWKVPLVQSTDDTSNLNDDDDDDDDEEDDSAVADGGELSIVWGDDGDTFDPITQVRHFSIRFDVSGLDDNTNENNDGTVASPDVTRTSLEQVVPMRLFTAQEIDALARCAGLEVVAMYGALEHDVDVNDEEASYRLVCVLQKQNR